MDGVYYETCEKCGKTFDVIVDKGDLWRDDISLYDCWNDDILCADCARDYVEHLDSDL